MCQGGLVPYAPDELRATHDWHHHVGYQQIWRRLPRCSQRNATVLGLGYFVACPLEDPPEQEPLVWFVVHHQDPRQLAHLPRSLSVTDNILIVITA